MSDVVGMAFTKESSGGSSSGSSSSGGSTDSGSETAPPQEETIQFDVSIRPNDSATVYVMQVTSLADTDRMSYQYSINGTDYYSLQKLQTQETFGASQKVDLHVRAVGSDDTILAAGNREITTPSASDVPTISGTDKFSDRTEVTITAPPRCDHLLHNRWYSANKWITAVQYTDYADRDDYDPGNCDRRWSYHE